MMNYQEPHTDFDFESIFDAEETSASFSASSDVDLVQHTLMRMATFIFAPATNGGQRCDRERTISLKALAAFAMLLRGRLGSDQLASLYRMSGLKSDKRSFYYHCTKFQHFVYTASVSGSILRP